MKPCRRGHTTGRSSDGHCVECVRLRHAAIRDRDANKQYMRNWRLANRDKCLAYEKKWRDTNPESNKVRSQNRRAREMFAEGFHTKEDLILLVSEQPNCQMCSAPFSETNPYSIDHIKPLILGGSNYPDNLQLLCRSCNSSKGARYNE